MAIRGALRALVDYYAALLNQGWFNCVDGLPLSDGVFTIGCGSTGRTGPVELSAADPRAAIGPRGRRVVPSVTTVEESR